VVEGRLRFFTGGQATILGSGDFPHLGAATGVAPVACRIGVGTGARLDHDLGLVPLRSRPSQLPPGHGLPEVDNIRHIDRLVDEPFGVDVDVVDRPIVPVFSQSDLQETHFPMRRDHNVEDLFSVVPHLGDVGQVGPRMNMARPSFVRLIETDEDAQHLHCFAGVVQTGDDSDAIDLEQSWQDDIRRPRIAEIILAEVPVGEQFGAQIRRRFPYRTGVSVPHLPVEAGSYPGAAILFGGGREVELRVTPQGGDGLRRNGDVSGFGP